MKIIIKDILLFLLAKRDKINDYLQIQNGNKDLDPILINDDIEFTYKLLILLKSFSLIVEKEDFNLFLTILSEYSTQCKTASETIYESKAMSGGHIISRCRGMRIEKKQE